MKITKAGFGKTKQGEAVDLYTLSNNKGTEISITNYGATVVSLKTPDKAGNFDDVVLGFDSLEGYLQEANPYFGAIIGRYGNRIGGGTFTLKGKTYKLATNNGPNHLHGGNKGFDKVVWEASEFQTDGGVGVKLHYMSPDGEEGYPGNLDVTVRYTLSNNNELKIDYTATTDQETPINLTSHSYFNLTGKGKTILDHQVMIKAAKIVAIDETSIPTGELMPVEGTPFDFRQPTAVGKRIGDNHEQLTRGIGYDHTFVLEGEAGNMRQVASVYEPTSGRMIEVLTEEPGMQFYTGNFLKGDLKGKGGAVYPHRGGLCLETQHFPDSPNHPQFPSVILKPGNTYQTATIYRFSVKKD